MQVEEWLGTDNELGIDIWNRKYCYNKESFKEWLDRISAGNKNIKELIKQKKFLFGGRILANRGLQNKGKKITFSNCFLAGQKILTKDGYKNIENIKVGDEVLTHTNRYQKVNALLSRQYDGDILSIKPRYGDTVKCTPNHEFLTNRGWVRADQLRVKSDNNASRNGLYYDLIKTINHTHTKKDESDGYYTQIVSVTKEHYDGYVYNLSVENDNSYNINGLVVHNCYVISPPDDNIESIFDCAKKLARTYSYGGGCGIDISKLSPRNAKINNAAKETSGSVSFMELYSLVTELIGQSGRRKH